jgi:hypothetical protein
MSNLKISQLPDYTGSTLGSWLIANNSGESETFKIQREDFLNGYAPSSDVSALSSSIATTDLNQNNTIATLATTSSLTALSSSIASAGYATTGSNTFIGDETISGSVLIQGTPGAIALAINQGNFRVSGSIAINASAPTGTRYLFFTHPSGSLWGSTISYSPLGGTYGSGSLSISNGISGSIRIGGTSENFIQGTNYIQGRTDISGSNTTITGSLGIRGNTQITGSITQTGSLTITGSITQTGSLTITGSIIQTGSVQGNVNALSISSNTASLNLNDGNFFTLQLVSGSATHLNPSNIKPGQTVSVFVNTIGSATMTFPSSIKQISGSAYTPTTGSGIDILTLISKDTSNLYLVNAKNFI